MSDSMRKHICFSAGFHIGPRFYTWPQSHTHETRKVSTMLRTAPLKAIILGAAISGLTVVGAGVAAADTEMALSQNGGSTISATATATGTGTGTDYGRGTTRSDNSPGTAGGLS